MRKLFSIISLLSSLTIHACPSFEFKDAVCVDESGNISKYQEISLTDNIIRFVSEAGDMYEISLPSSGVNDSSTYKVECDQGTILDRETVNGKTYDIRWEVLNGTLVRSGIEVLGYYEGGHTDTAYVKMTCK